MALGFGNQKLNMHEAGKEFEPKAHNAVPGSADLCFIADMELGPAIEYVKSFGIKIIEGPVIPSCAHTGKNWRLEPPFSKGGQGGFCEWRFYLFERNLV